MPPQRRKKMAEKNSEKEAAPTAAMEKNSEKGAAPAATPEKEAASDTPSTAAQPALEQQPKTAAVQVKAYRTEAARRAAAGKSTAAGKFAARRAAAEKTMAAGKPIVAKKTTAVGTEPTAENSPAPPLPEQQPAAAPPPPTSDSNSISRNEILIQAAELMAADLRRVKARAKSLTKVDAVPKGRVQPKRAKHPSSIDMNQVPEDGHTASESEEEADAVNESPSLPLTAEGQGKQQEDGNLQKEGMVEVLSDEVAKRERKRKGKQPVEQRKKRKAAQRALLRPRPQGPVIRSPPDSGIEESSSTDSSSSSDEERHLRAPEIESPELPDRFEKFLIEFNEEDLGSLTEFDDPKLTGNYKKRFKELKSYKSGSMVHFDTLDELQVHDEFLEYMDMGGFTWLLFLESHDLPRALVDEFFTTFCFDITTDLHTPSVHFRLFNTYYHMSLHEWSVRLGLYTVKEIGNGEVGKLECGLPGRHVECDLNEAWRRIRGKDGTYHYARAVGEEILDPALRLCQVFLVTNLIGMSTSYSRIPAATLYFMWCSVRGVKLHLGFWIAYQIHVISRRPSRNFTLCHLLGKFIHDNFEFVDCISPMKANPQVNPPRAFDLEFLRRAGLVRMSRGSPRFYTVGESPSLMISRGRAGGEQEDNETKKRLKKMEKKLTAVQIAHEEVTKELRETRAAQAQGQKDLKADLERLMVIVGQLAQLRPPPVPEIVPAHTSASAPAPEILPAHTSASAPVSEPTSEPISGFVVEHEAVTPPPPAAAARTPRKRRGR